MGKLVFFKHSIWCVFRIILKKQFQGTPKQFGSSGEIQIWKDVSFWLFFQFLCHMPQRNWIFFQYCLSQWVTATKNCFVCRTEPLRQTDLLFVALSHCDKQSLFMFRKKTQKGPKMLIFFGTFCHLLALFVTFWHLVCPFSYFFSQNSTHFGNLCAIDINFVCRSDSVRQTKNPFVAVTQCNKQNKPLSQWLSATNNIENKSILFVACDKGIGQKSQKQTSFQIWISPPLSNYFGVPYEKYGWSVTIWHCDIVSFQMLFCVRNMAALWHYDTVLMCPSKCNSIWELCLLCDIMTLC